MERQCITRQEAERFLKQRKEVEIKRKGKTYRGMIIVQYGGSNFFIFVGRNGRGPEIRIMVQANEFFRLGR